MAEQTQIHDSEQLKRMIVTYAQQKSVRKGAKDILSKIMRGIDQLEVLVEAVDHYKETGGKNSLPKDLKKRLAEKLNYSEKTIEVIVYNVLSRSDKIIDHYQWLMSKGHQKELVLEMLSATYNIDQELIKIIIQ